MLAMRTWLLAALALGACYQPDLGPNKFQCASGDPCPDGQVCKNGYCRAPDEGEDEGRDGGGGGGGSDMRPPQVAGCSGSGAKVADKVYACRGSFRTGEYKTLCGGGHHACGAARDGMSLAGVKSCSSGFFAVELDASGRWDRDLQVSCPPQTGGGNFPVIIGCGDEDGVIDKGVNVSACGAVQSLPALRSAVTCIADLFNPWKCTSGLGDARHDARDNKGGTLCCQD